MDEFTVRLLSNANVFNINQDELGYVAKVIRNKDDETIMVKEMSDGTKILAIFNRNVNEEKIINFKWSEIKETVAFSAYDVWRQKEAGIYPEGVSVKLSPDGVVLFKLTQAKQP